MGVETKLNAETHSTMGNPTPPAFIGPRGLINRTEYVRILEQALAALGYPDLAAQLEAQSGIVLQPPTATAFREAVLSGNFEAALDLLPSLGSSSASIQRARFLLLRHKYSEAIAAGDLKGALHTLRHELQPFQNATDTGTGGGGGMKPDALQGLAAMLVSGSNNTNSNNTTEAATAAAMAVHREGLLADLQTLLPPSLLVPDARLEDLIEQALLAQLDRCPYHNSRGLQMSLFTDYSAGPEQLPTELAQVLHAHTDEVWAVQFSRDGKWMATASKDGSALLWAVTAAGTVQLERNLLTNAGPVNIIAFSPDSEMIVAGGHEGNLFVFNLKDGGGGGGATTALPLVKVRMEAMDSITTALWFPNSSHLVVVNNRSLQAIKMKRTASGINNNIGGGGDGEPHGLVVDRVTLGQHTYDAVLSLDGGTVISVGQDRRLRFFRLSDRREMFIGPEPASVTCLSTSPDGRFLAANMNNGVIHLWPLGDMRSPADTEDSEDDDGDTLPFQTLQSTNTRGSDPMDALPTAPLQEFRITDAHPGRFVIRSAFGGAGYSFLACGSEGGAGTVHIWHRESGELLAALQGHTGTVNSVAWNPRNQYMLASVSDDASVRIWRAPAAAVGISC